MRIAAAALISACIAGSASAAEKWGIDHERKARFEAKVVDILCELTGDCPPDCGAGRRHLGLLTAEGRLIPAVKNFDPFAGTQADLAPFCGRRVVVDGLMIDNPKVPMFVVQFKRAAGPQGEWTRANWFTEAWSKSHPGKDASRWFRHDGRIADEIARTGKLGIPGLKLGE